MNWQRVGRVALTIVLFAVLASYLNPVVNFIDSWRDSRANEERLAELKREKRMLERRAAEALTQPVVEREARRLGYIRPDERAYVVRGLRD